MSLPCEPEGATNADNWGCTGGAVASTVSLRAVPSYVVMHVRCNVGRCVGCFPRAAATQLGGALVMVVVVAVGWCVGRLR